MTVAKFWDGSAWVTTQLTGAQYAALDSRLAAQEQKHKAYGVWGSDANRAFNAGNNHYNWASTPLDFSTFAQAYFAPDAGGDEIKILVPGYFEIHCVCLTYLTVAATTRIDANLLINGSAVCSHIGHTNLSPSIPYASHTLYFEGALALNDLVGANVGTAGATYPDSANMSFNRLTINYRGPL